MFGDYFKLLLVNIHHASNLQNLFMQLENNYNAGLSKNYQISPPTLNFSKSAKLTINKNLMQAETSTSRQQTFNQSQSM